MAVIGSRQAGDRAMRWAHKLAGWLAEAKVNVVSGDARGIDRAAEAGAAERHGPVTAVLPMGLLRWEGNDDVALALSSCYPTSPFSALQALVRNGHIAALAWCVVVAESRNVGGTWNAANQALAQGRPVLCRPDEPQTGNPALLHLGARPLSLDPLLAAEQVLRQLESCPGVPELDDEPTLPGCSPSSLEPPATIQSASCVRLAPATREGLVMGKPDSQEDLEQGDAVGEHSGRGGGGRPAQRRAGAGAEARQLDTALRLSADPLLRGVACGSWWTPIGPASYEVSWLPFIILPLVLVATLLAAPMPVPETTLRRLPPHEPAREDTLATVLWGLLGVLLLMLLLLVFLN